MWNPRLTILYLGEVGSPCRVLYVIERIDWIPSERTPSGESTLGRNDHNSYHQSIIIKKKRKTLGKKESLESHLLLKTLHSFQVTHASWFLCLSSSQETKEIGLVCLKTYFNKPFQEVYSGLWTWRTIHWWTIPLKFLHQKLLKTFRLKLQYNSKVRK